MNPNGRKWPAAVLRGLAWGVAIAAALYVVALWLLFRPLASSVAEDWVETINNEPAGVAEDPATPPDEAEPSSSGDHPGAEVAVPTGPDEPSGESPPYEPLRMMSSATVGDWTLSAWSSRPDEPLVFRLERGGEAVFWEPTDAGRQIWTTVSIVPLPGALGHDGFLLSYETDHVCPPCEWEYWISDGDGLRLAAESFGRKEDGDGLWAVDVDDDGVAEMIGNHTFVNGPHPGVRLFRNAGGTIEFCDDVRPLLQEPESWMGSDSWSRYDPETGKVRIRFLPREWVEDPPDEGISVDLMETADCSILPELLVWRPFERK